MQIQGITEGEMFFEVRVSSPMSYQSIRERIAESLGLDQKSVITFPGSDFGMRGKVVVIFKADTDINNPGEIISRLEPLSQVA